MSGKKTWGELTGIAENWSSTPIKEVVAGEFESSPIVLQLAWDGDIFDGGSQSPDVVHLEADGVRYVYHRVRMEPMVLVEEARE